MPGLFGFANLAGGGGAGAAATGAAFPWLSAIGIGGGLLSGLFGAKQRKPNIGEMNRLFGTGALSGDTMNLYRMLAASPQFRQTLMQNAVSGQQLSGNISAGLAQRGLGTSGIGTIANALGGSAASFNESSLRGGLFGQAGNMALQNLLARLQSYTELQSQSQSRPNFLESFGSSLLGAGGTSLLR